MLLKTTGIRVVHNIHEFVASQENAELFKYVFGYTPCHTNIKRKLKTQKNWHSDMEIIQKVLDSKPGRYAVGTHHYTSYEEPDRGYSIEFIVILTLEELDECLHLV